MSASRISVTTTIAFVSLALASCGGPLSPALDDARARVQTAQADPELQSYAPLALNNAVDALARAEAAQAAGEGSEEVTHLAYLTTQNVEIAELRAAEKEAQTRIEGLGEQRSEIRVQQAEDRAAELERQLAALQAEQTERGYVMTLGDILFDVDESTLTAGGLQEVSRLAQFMREFPARNVVIEGHTDSTGTDSYNQQLSERRALAVQDALLRQGIDPSRIASRGYGERYPEVSNDNAAGRQQNRRVEIVILDAGERPVPRA